MDAEAEVETFLSFLRDEGVINPVVGSSSLQESMEANFDFLDESRLQALVTRALAEWETLVPRETDTRTVSAVECSDGVIFSIIEEWRRREKDRLRKIMSRLMLDGYTVIKGVCPQKKEQAWKILEEKINSHWKKSRGRNFDIAEQATWPRPKDGRAYKDTLTDKVEGLPRLYSENYEAQALLCMLVDSSLSQAHFGANTHSKLRLLIGLDEYCVGVSKSPLGSLELFGSDQAWHIVNWPNPESGMVGQAIKKGAHVDGGQFDVYTRKGVPCWPEDGDPGLERTLSSSDSSSDDLASSMSPSQWMLPMAACQMAILFYCDTPGHLSAARGATAFFPDSHFIVLEAVRRNFLKQKSPSLKLKEAMKRWGEMDVNACRRRQVEYGPDEVVLALGPLAHVTVVPIEPMPGNRPRVIQNCKAHIAMHVLKDPCRRLSFLKALPVDAPLVRLFTQPLQLFDELTRGDHSPEDREDRTAYVHAQVENLAGLL